MRRARERRHRGERNARGAHERAPRWRACQWLSHALAPARRGRTPVARSPRRSREPPSRSSACAQHRKRAAAARGSVGDGLPLLASSGREVVKEPPTMSSNELAHACAAELAALIRTRHVSAVEAMRAVLAQSERVQAQCNCFITLCGDAALADAAEADRAIARGEELGALHGLPFHAKDMVDTKGVRTTFASAMYADRVP